MIKKDFVIIGAGLTGLTTAYYLNKANKDIFILETRDRVGGVINTVNTENFLYEDGPNTGVLASVAAAQLLEDLGDKCSLEEASKEVNKRYVCKNGKLHALPMNPIQAALTPLITWYDKFRILLEPIRKRGTDPHETLASLVKRRMGQSFLDYAIDPFILGIYSGDPGKLVPKYALPKLYNLEQKYGSFVVGALKKMLEPKSEAEKKVTRKVFTCVGGLSSMTSAMHDSIGKDRFMLGVDDVTITNNGSVFIVTAKDSNGNNISIQANNVITTTGAASLPKLIPFVDKQKLDIITNLKYAKVLEVAVGYNKWDGMKLDGFGGLIPFKENRDILGILFMSTLFKNRAPENGALLSIFIGGVRREELTHLSDSEVTELVKSEISKLLYCDREPDLIKIGRHERAIPQYYADSGERFDAIRSIEKKYPGLILGGNIRDGIGMANRIQQGKDIADTITNPK